MEYLALTGKCGLHTKELHITKTKTQERLNRTPFFFQSDNTKQVQFVVRMVIKMVSGQFLFADKKGSRNIHHLGSTPFLCDYETFFLPTVWKQNTEIPLKCLTCAVCSGNSFYISIDDFPEFIF